MQNPLELILTRQWANLLPHAVWIMDDKGNLIYYNHPAENILGLRYDVSGVLSARDLGKVFKYTQVDDTIISIESLPINIALKMQRPAHRIFKILCLGGKWKVLESTAFPLIDQNGTILGAASLFWEVNNI